MAIEKISIQAFLQMSAHYPVLDVRSPGEYRHAHLPGAFSFPLFSDEERKVVGTTYKQESREAAIRIGLDYFGPKMRRMVEEAVAIGNSHFEARSGVDKPGQTTPQNQTLLLYCWRGGMRSAGVAWLLDLYGFKVFTLRGGYKQFRNHVLQSFEQPLRLRLLGGNTGSGKTELLHGLRNEGEQVIDLEDLARHKGSAFGNIGMPEQPTQEMFENQLAMKILALGFAGTGSEPAPIWLEDESQRIGHVNIPGALWQQMRRSPVCFLDVPFEERLNHVVEEYGTLDRERMIDAITRIGKRLGGLETKNAIRYLLENNVRESFRILLRYYDKWYGKSLHNRENLNSLLHKIPCKNAGKGNLRLLLNQYPV